MHRIPKWKLLISIIWTIIALIYALPNFKNLGAGWSLQNKLNLGLDLQGGVHLLLETDFKSYLTEVTGNLADNIKKSFKEEKIGYKNFSLKKDVVQFELRDIESFKRAKKIINNIDYNLKILNENGNIKVQYDEANYSYLLNKVIEQSIEIIRLRVDGSGIKEPVIQRQGNNHILLQVPGEDNPQNLKNALGQTAKLTFHLVDEASSIQEAFKGHLPANLMLVKDAGEHYLLVKKKPALTGEHLTSAKVMFDKNSLAAVAFSFDNYGSKIFAEITKKNSGRRLAIILDNKLLSSPVINEPILGGNGIISGNFTIESANELALLLESGALPAPLNIVEEKSIGPSLGADSIAAGKKAAVIAFASVATFMIWSYGIFGLFANIALTLSLLYIIALLTMLQATLTLPGIAGIILTIGMAVDANVLIYERIREELSKGSSNLYAIKLGFESAFATIADSNITTLIAAFLLYIFGVGAIKGFAVTLTIGILSSMFSAIIVTKLLIDLWVQYCRPNSLEQIFCNLSSSNKSQN